MIDNIASVTAGRFTAWFDKVDDNYEIQWWDKNHPRAYSFKDPQVAKEFWHKEVIERHSFKHCYCC